jgi:hypothetical protein
LATFNASQPLYATRVSKPLVARNAASASAESIKSSTTSTRGGIECAAKRAAVQTQLRVGVKVRSCMLCSLFV